MKVKGLQSGPDLCLCLPDLENAYKDRTGWFASTVDLGLAFGMVVKNWLWAKFRYFQCKARLLMLTFRLVLWLLRATGSGGLGLQPPREKGRTTAQPASLQFVLSHN